VRFRIFHLPRFFLNIAMRRVFVGLVEIGGYYAGLVKGLRDLRVEVSHVSVIQHPFYPLPPARGSWVIAASNWFTPWFYRAQTNRATRWLCKPVRWLQLRILFVWAVARHDVFVFGFGFTFCDTKELPLLKFFGKKLIFVFNGSDTRPPYLDGSFVAQPIPSLVTMAAQVKRQVMRIEEYADVCVDHPLSAHFHEKPFVNYLRVGNPSYLEEAAALQNEGADDDKHPETAVRIVHAPSVPSVKGSARFRELVDRFKKAGALIDYVELSKRPHHEVLSELKRCDFALDQLYSDTPLAGFATEAASFGKPALIGGYGTDALRQTTVGIGLPMDTYCHPAELENVFERLVNDAAWRRECGERALRFVRDNWQPRFRAERFLRLIEGEAPADWLFAPQDISYLHGAGIAEDVLRKRLTELIEFGGIGALQLADKPKLERAILDFAQGKPTQGQ
jgi:glycosyltransferase involved in cell wall biosynthesis